MKDEIKDSNPGPLNEIPGDDEGELSPVEMSPELLKELAEQPAEAEFDEPFEHKTMHPWVVWIGSGLMGVLIALFLVVIVEELTFPALSNAVLFVCFLIFEVGLSVAAHRFFAPRPRPPSQAGQAYDVDPGPIHPK